MSKYGGLLAALDAAIDKARAKVSAPAGFPWHDYAADPLALAAKCWPAVRFYDRQREIIESVRDTPETYITSGNQLGKDFVAGFLILWALLCHPEARIVTTSVREAHLLVLWSELFRFIDTSNVPLRHTSGGPLIVNHREVKKVGCPRSYLIGTTSERGEGLQGHHAPYSLAVLDEASGINDVVPQMVGTWAKRKLVFGNPLSTSGFFKAACKGGDVRGTDGRLFRKVIQLPASASPNVIRGELAAAGVPESEWPDATPGVIDYDEYLLRRATYDQVRACIGLDAEFWEGSDALMFPPTWLNESARRALQLDLQARHAGVVRKAKAIGIDPAEGGDKTAMAAVDELGLLDLEARKTPDTDVLCGEVAAFIRRHGVDPSRCCVDRGGGGKPLADRLRGLGLPVRTVAFGEAVTPPPKRGRVRVDERRQQQEAKYAFANRRSQLYFDLRQLLDPATNAYPFALPSRYGELRRQLAPIPLTYSPEGRITLLPKHRRAGGNEKCLADIIGCSPDEADSVCLAVHAMLHQEQRRRAGPLRDPNEDYGEEPEPW